MLDRGQSCDWLSREGGPNEEFLLLNAGFSSNIAHALPLQIVITRMRGRIVLSLDGECWRLRDASLLSHGRPIRQIQGRLFTWTYTSEFLPISDN